MKLKSLLITLLFCVGLIFSCEDDKNQLSVNELPSSSTKGNTARGPKFQNLLIDVPGLQLGFISNYDSDTKEFDKYYVFQYNSDISLFDVSEISEPTFVSYDSETLKLLIDGKVNAFTINASYIGAPDENVYYGYGLSERESIEATFILVDTDNEISDIGEMIDIQLTDKTMASKSDPITCSSGGEGATACSTSGPMAQGQCSVTCSAGYACCDNKTIKCMCQGIVAKLGKVAKPVLSKKKS